MNLFRVLASGRFPLREEVVSAYLAYLLAPRMDHGLGPLVLTSLLQTISKAQPHNDIAAVAHQFQHQLRSDLFGDSTEVGVELELVYPTGMSVGYIDVVVRCGEWFIAIENKIALASAEKGQLQKQYIGLRRVLADRERAKHRICMVYLVPALHTRDGWSLATSTQQELEFAREDGDMAVLMTWQPTQGGPPSFVEMLRGLLIRESQGEISPMSYDIRQSLLAFIDFAIGEFQGYPYERTIGPSNQDVRRVSDLLASDTSLFVGVQHGMAGLIRRAWRDPAFVNQQLPVAEEPRGWQYLSLRDFKKLAEWAMHPEIHDLTGIAWSGKPFYTTQLYLVAKAAGNSLFIGMRGGLAALKSMSPEQLRAPRTWEVSTEHHNSQWFTAQEFCAALEAVGVTFDQPNMMTEE